MLINRGLNNSSTNCNSCFIRFSFKGEGQLGKLITEQLIRNRQRVGTPITKPMC